MDNFFIDEEKRLVFVCDINIDKHTGHYETFENSKDAADYVGVSIGAINNAINNEGQVIEGKNGHKFMVTDNEIKVWFLEEYI